MFKTDKELEATKDEGRLVGTGNDKSRAVAAALHSVAQQKKTEITSVALAYIRHKYPYVYPIVGGRKVEHLQQNINALALELTDAEVDEIENALPFDVGFPMNMLFEYGGKKKHKSYMGPGHIPLLQAGGPIDVAVREQPPQPHGLGAYQTDL